MAPKAYMRVCVCVWGNTIVRDRERKREREKKRVLS